MMSYRKSCTVAVLALLACGASIAQFGKGAPATEQARLGVAIPMRDGVRLAADLFIPSGTARWPAVLVRTPYNRKSPNMRSYHVFTRNGYALVVQDVRGRYGSQGNFGDIAQEGPDGNDTINWIAEQPWSNGRVAMAGSSYLGIVQWWAAVQDNPHLRAIAPMESGDDEYLDRFYSTGGALQVGHRLLWIAQNLTPPSELRRPFGTYIWHLPPRTSDQAATGRGLPLWRDAISHPSYDAYWNRKSIREQLDRISVPVLSFGGWFDNYAESDLDAFSRLARRHKRIETWIGPWSHNPGWKFATRDFGPLSNIHIRMKQLHWFDQCLKNIPADVFQPAGARLHIFVMGPNVWREEREWPLARTRYTPLYLSSGGHANSSSGDGSLAWQAPPTEADDQFIYDPKNPVPTVGGAVCCDPNTFAPGPLNQTAVETRRDVLVYTSGPLKQDLEVTGPIRVRLYVATSANDTDFTAKLVDVQPDGTPLLVTDGIQRLRYRLSLNRPQFVKRNAPYQINIDAGVTSYVFAASHRIRLEISSSNFPRFDRNLNSSGPNGDQTKAAKVKQTIFHRNEYRSTLILPVIGGPDLTIASAKRLTPGRVPQRISSSSPSNAVSGAP